MKIAPIDIVHKTFSRKMMGLDQDEVMDFLKSVASELENTIRERNQLRESLREKDLAIIDFKERDELLKSTITTAQKMSERIQSDANREAKLILHDAHQKAEMIQRDARDSLKRVYQEVSDLKRLRMQFEHNLKAVVQSHLAMIEQSQSLVPSPNLDPSMGNFIASSETSPRAINEARLDKGPERNFDKSSEKFADKKLDKVGDRVQAAIKRAVNNKAADTNSY